MFWTPTWTKIPVYVRVSFLANVSSRSRKKRDGSISDDDACSSELQSVTRFRATLDPLKSRLDGDETPEAGSAYRRSIGLLSTDSVSVTVDRRSPTTFDRRPSVGHGYEDGPPGVLPARPIGTGCADRQTSIRREIGIHDVIPSTVPRFWATVCKTVGPMLSDRCLSVCPVCPVCPVYDVGVLWPNGWTVGWIKMPLGRG